jgi:hypothetical protein
VFRDLVYRPLMRYLVLAFAIVMSSTEARAEEASPPILSAHAAPQPKRIRDAYLVSWAATALPLVASVLIAGEEGNGARGAIGGTLGITAMIVGPSAGHWYAGRTWTTGLKLRLAGGAIVGAMVLGEQYRPLDTGTVITGLLTAVALWEVGVIWDVVTIPRAVRRHNREQARAFAIAPFATERSAGLGIAGAF